MTQNFYKFGSIEQFKNVVKNVKDYCNKNEKPLPILEFKGSTKVHGTNCAVVFNKNGGYHAQSRERILSLTSDNMGFAMFVERVIEDLRKTYDAVVAKTGTTRDVVIFGEWAGPGVQSGVGISMIPNKKMFVFNITLCDGEDRIELTQDEIKEVLFRTEDIKTVYDYKTWTVQIDFSKPHEIQNYLVEETLKVEEECPIAKEFGFSGIGEGVVYWNHELNLKMKIKGEKHSSSKVKTVKQIAAVDIERMNSAQEFVESVITENRLNQGITKLGEMGLEVDIKNTGVFIKWIVADALKEEHDVIVASSFEIKELTPKMSVIAKNFYFEYMDKNL